MAILFDSGTDRLELGTPYLAGTRNPAVLLFRAAINATQPTSASRVFEASRLRVQAVDDQSALVLEFQKTSGVLLIRIPKSAIPWDGAYRTYCIQKAATPDGNHSVFVDGVDITSSLVVLGDSGLFIEEMGAWTVFGNRPDQIRALSGGIEFLHYWDNLESANLAQSLSNGLSPSFVPQSSDLSVEFPGEPRVLSGQSIVSNVNDGYEAGVGSYRIWPAQPITVIPPGISTFSPDIASGTATALAPTFSGTGSATFVPAVAIATATGLDSVLNGTGAAGIAPAIAVATGTAIDPTLAGSGTAALSPDVAAAISTGLDSAFAGSGSADFLPSTAQGAAAALDPIISGSGPATFAHAVAIGSGAALDPAFSGTGNASLNPGIATGTGTAPAPTFSLLSGLNFPPTVATGTATGLEPGFTGSGAAVLSPDVATGFAIAPGIGLVGSGAAVLSPDVAVATATALDPAFSITQPIFAADVAVATAISPPPTFVGSGTATLFPGVAIGVGVGISPTFALPIDTFPTHGTLRVNKAPSTLTARKVSSPKQARRIHYDS